MDKPRAVGKSPTGKEDLDQALLTNSLESRKVNVYVKPTIDSTNALVKQRLDGQLPMLVVADYQPKGRGRLQRTWLSAPGCTLTFTLAIALTTANYAGLSLAIATATANYLTKSGCPIKLKWPNDLLSEDGKKLGGILIEITGSPPVALIGMGLNLHKFDELENELTDVSWLFAHMKPCNRNTLLIKLIETMLLTMDQWQQNGLKDFRSKWMQKSIYQPDDLIMLSDASGNKQQMSFVGLAQDGKLIAKIQKGLFWSLVVEKLSTLLAIDVGNTRIKWAVWSGQAWTNHGVTSTSKPDISSLVSTAKSVNNIVGCCVAGNDIKKTLEQELADLLVTWVTPSADNSIITVNYDLKSLGADRYCALLGMRKNFECGVVVMLGTAVTIDYLDSKGVFQGGLILPGRHLMHDAIATHTQIEYVDVNQEKKPNLFPQTTDEAITSGSLYSICATITLMQKKWQATDLPLVILGGNTEEIATLIPAAQPFSDLIFDGLRHSQIKI